MKRFGPLFLSLVLCSALVANAQHGGRGGGGGNSRGGGGGYSRGGGSPGPQGGGSYSRGGAPGGGYQARQQNGGGGSNNFQGGGGSSGGDRGSVAQGGNASAGPITPSQRSRTASRAGNGQRGPSTPTPTIANGGGPNAGGSNGGPPNGGSPNGGAHGGGRPDSGGIGQQSNSGSPRHGTGHSNGGTNGAGASQGGGPRNEGNASHRSDGSQNHGGSRGGASGNAHDGGGNNSHAHNGGNNRGHDSHGSNSHGRGSNDNWHGSSHGHNGGHNGGGDFNRNHGGHGGGNQYGHHFDHYYNRHQAWYHDHWHGYWGRPWAYQPYGWYWGGGWGASWGFNVGSVNVGLSYGSPWAWGYYDYWNPYWVAPPVRSVTYINYAQPIIVQPAPVVVSQAPAPAQTTFSPTADSPPTLDGTPPENYPTDNPNDELTANNDPSNKPADDKQEQALAIFDTARALFKRGDYKMALSQTDRAVALLPNDPMMHEFRSLCLFAMKDYGQSAAAAYAVLSVGPGWDKETLEGLYNNMAVYQLQLQALESYRTANPQAANARFLLAYHKLLAGKNDEAIAELQTVVKLQPKDRLAAQLLKGLTSPEEKQEGPELGSPTPAVAVDAEKLPGNWTAERSDGAKIELNMAADHTFTWTVAQEDKPQKLSGTYSFADNYLILSAKGQNALVGQVSMASADQLTFKLAGGSPHDPGLTFVR